LPESRSTRVRNSRAELDQWAYTNGVRLTYVEPGEPIQNAYIETFNARLRDECLNQHWFQSLGDARRLIEQWREDYNEDRPHRVRGDRLVPDRCQGELR